MLVFWDDLKLKFHSNYILLKILIFRSISNKHWKYYKKEKKKWGCSLTATTKRQQEKDSKPSLHSTRCGCGTRCYQILLAMSFSNRRKKTPKPSQNNIPANLRTFLNFLFFFLTFPLNLSKANWKVPVVWVERTASSTGEHQPSNVFEAPRCWGKQYYNNFITSQLLVKRNMRQSAMKNGSGGVHY